MKRISKISSGVFVSLAACFMLFIFAPLEIYMSNPGEVWYKAPLLLKYCLLLFCVFFLVSILFFALLRLCGGKAYTCFLTIYFSAFIACYVQGNFFVKSLPTLDGAEIDWSLYRAEQIQSAVIWGGAFAAGALLLVFLHREKFCRMVSYLSVFLFLILSITLITVCINGSRHEKTDYLTSVKGNQFEMSDERNFIILVLDAVDEEWFRDVLQQHPEYQEAFRDFTYFNNVLSGYPATEPSMALLMSGEWYEPKETFEEYTQRVYSESVFFDNLEQNGYQLSLYDDSLLLERERMEGKFANMIYIELTASDPLIFMERQMKMVGIKYAPYQLKPYCWFDAHSLWNHRSHEYSNELFSWNNAMFYEDVMGSEITYTDSPQFKMIHLMGAHMPFIYDEELNESADADCSSSIAGCMKMTAAYLDKLREAGVYDNSVILILSDHGLNEEKMLDDKRMHPILLIKGMGESHELRMSDAPVSYEDMVDAYDKLLQGSRSDEIFIFPEGNERVRKYMFYWPARTDIEVYSQSGYAGDESNLTLKEVIDLK